MTIETLKGAWRRVPTSVWTLGFVSMFMDTSSELIHSLLPVFLVTTLGASAVTVGLIEGFAEATAAVTKVFSGVLSDRLGHRKLLVATGYSLGALTKPIFPLAATPLQVLGARFVDRVGKGIRGAPRDALVADVTPPAIRGVAYGVRQAIDTIGAFTGPLLAIWLMALYDNDFRAVFWWATVPAALAVLLIFVGVREPQGIQRSKRRGWPIHRDELGRLPKGFWRVVAVGVVFTLSRFSEAFLVLKAQGEGLALMLIPLVLVVMNVVYAVAAGPAGALSDRIGQPKILVAGLLVLVLADLVLALVPGLAGVFLGVALWGLHMGMSQGLLAAMVADTAPDDLRGTAFGFFNLITGFVLLAASGIAGWLWSAQGPAATFLAGAVFANIAALMMMTQLRAPRKDLPL